MRILKKAKIIPVTCKICGCVFKPSQRDLRQTPFTDRKTGADCPTCDTRNDVTFYIKEDTNNG